MLAVRSQRTLDTIAAHRVANGGDAIAVRADVERIAQVAIER